VSSGSSIAKPILPGATIGIFGGGQLGRMTAMAARGMGYRILVLDPDPACPARFVVDGCIEAGWDDSREAANLARGCDVVTLEIEQISPGSMEAAASYAPVRPGGAMLAVIQDRIEQKDWLRRNGFPVGDYRAVRSLDQLREAVSALGGKCFCKSATGGYDGRGQGKVGFAPGAVVEDEIRGAWEALGERAGVAEKAVELEREISVLVARAPNGEVKVYPPAWNHHEEQILAWSVIPAPITKAIETEAREIAEAIADTFQLEGVLDPDGSAREPRFDKALGVPGVRLHLYEKHKPRKGRKMGHLSAVGTTPDEAVELVLRAKALLEEIV
jgi:5-(carboxyamino)imidazole ribonucleotide synthase